MAVANLTVQKQLAEAWGEHDQSANIHAIATIQEAVELVQEISEDIGETNIFVTGSFHLVGGALSILEGTLSPTH